MIQGLGLGFVFMPLSTLAFATLDPRLRTEATSLFSLVRNLGSSVGISIMAAMLTRNIATGHASLVSRVTLFNDNLTGAGFSPLSFATPAGWEAAARLDGMITLQAAMIAYLDDFKLMFLITLCAAPLLFLLRYRPAAPPGGATSAVPASAPPVAVHAD